jgi:hypothetical protein
MRPEDLLQHLRRRPFVPFLIHMSDGTVYEVRHPELVMVGRSSAIVGFPLRPGDLVIDRSEWVALLHIVRIEPLGTVEPPESPPAPPAGPPAGAPMG